MNVVVAAWTLGSAPSGAKQRTLGLLRAIAPTLHDGEHVHVVHRPELVAEELGPRVSWHRTHALPAGPTALRALRERRVLPALLGELAADVFDLSTLPVPPALPCRVVLTIHDLRDLDRCEGRSRIVPHTVLRALVRRSVSRAERVITPSDFTAARLREHLHDATPRVHVIRGGIDAMRIRTVEAAHRGRAIVHIGHLEPRKRVDRLLHALPHLPPDVRLELYGADHGAGARLRALADRLGVTARVSFGGAVADDVLARAYATAGVVAVPSDYEGFGLAVLEALAIGAPLVIADAGALPEVLGTAPGTIVHGDDARAWADALARALDERPVRATDVAARHERARALTWPTAAPAVLACWREVAAANAARSR